MHYDDMVIEVSEPTLRRQGDKRLGAFKVRVLSSPVGEMSPGDAVTVEYDDKNLQSSLAKLDRRELDEAGLMAIGRTLGALLLPIASESGAMTVREFFARSLVKLGLDTGLRLRLRLPPDLAVIPWEYAYVERAGGSGFDGFLALDPHIAIVRHEVLAAPVSEPVLSGDIKVVAALAEAEGLPELNLDNEMKLLNEALSGLDGIRVEPCRGATLQKLQPMLPGAGVFHFAGHGDFTREMGARPGTYTGVGFLALGDERIDASQLGINLRGQGIRLAVLAGCNTGRRDGISVWSGIAPALVKAVIPAVVANQYKITDKCAIALSHQFYQALAGGLPIERALSAGRIAAYNADKTGRDWGVPVLYLRAANGQLFSGAADPEARERCRKAADADVAVRAKEVKAGGVLHGAEVSRMMEGKLAVAVGVAGTVSGEVVGADIRRQEGGSASIQVDVGEVGAGGKLTGAKIGTLGVERESQREESERGRTAERDRLSEEEHHRLDEQRRREEEHHRLERSYGDLHSHRESQRLDEVRAAIERLRQDEERAVIERLRQLEFAKITANVEVGSVTGGQVIGTQVNRREGARVQGNQVNVDSGGHASVNTGFSGPVNIAGPVTIVQGSTGIQPSASTVPPEHEHLIEEKLRLDAALPESAVVNEPFDLVIAVRQPDAPVLAVADLDQVVSGEGSIFRSEDDDVVKYRVEVTGAGFEVAPKSYLIELRPGTNSRPVAFQVTSSKTGKRSLFVNAYQEDGVLAAQTRITMKVVVAVAPE